MLTLNLLCKGLIRIIMLPILKNIKSKFLAVLFIKFVLMIELENQLFFIEKKMKFIDPLHQLLKNKNTVERL